MVLLIIGSSAATKEQPKADNKANKKAKAKAATTTKKGQQQQKAKAQPQQKKPQQQKAQQQKQKGKRETQAHEAAMEDTKDNRLYHAARVLQGTPLIETLEGLVQEAARVKGPDAAEVSVSERRNGGGTGGG